MESKPLVSMITYCYNGERFVSKYFEAVLAQTYTNIELVFFDNGSEDRTYEIAQHYREKLENRGMVVQIIHYEKNQNTCILKQKAFREMHGEYFFGCDSDDLIDPTYVEEMLNYLLAHPEKGLVFCQLRCVIEDTNELCGILKSIPRTGERQAFNDILQGNNITFTCISYMMSKKYLEQVNPEKMLYPSRFGENYQVLIPFLYYDLQGYIEKPLGQYTVRTDSYSATLNAEKRVIALKGQERSVLATLDLIHPENQDSYEYIFLKRIRRDRFYSALLCKDKKKLLECWYELKAVGGAGFKETISCLLYRFGLFRIVKKILHK